MPTIKLEILHGGLMSSIQDKGRQGLAFYGVPSSGAMDLEAMYLANSILDNPIDNSVIECHQMGVTIKFHDECTFAITGSNLGWTLQDKLLEINTPYHAERNAVLKPKRNRDNFRSYIAFKGAIITESTFNSTSTYPLYGWGGNNGRLLTKGDFLGIRKSPQRVRPHYTNIQYKLNPSREIKFHPGPEWSYLTKEQQDIFIHNPFMITSESNRMGARLKGPSLIQPKQLINSVPVLPGFIQLFPSGQLTVILRDGQTTGGYPRVAYIPSQALNAFNQLLPGVAFRFINI